MEATIFKHPLNQNKTYHREDNYIGLKGLQRFLSGEYATYTANFPAVGMLGYVLSDTVEHWRIRLKNAIDQNKTQLRLRLPQRDILIISYFPTQWLSEHNRESSNEPIIIYHVLLNCCF